MKKLLLFFTVTVSMLPVTAHEDIIFGLPGLLEDHREYTTEPIKKSVNVVQPPQAVGVENLRIAVAPATMDAKQRLESLLKSLRAIGVIVAPTTTDVKQRDFISEFLTKQKDTWEKLEKKESNKANVLQSYLNSESSIITKKTVLSIVVTELVLVLAFFGFCKFARI